MDRRQFIKSLSIPLTAGLTGLTSGHEPIGLQSRFRVLGEPIDANLLSVIKDYRSAYHDFSALNLEQQILIKHHEEADLQHIKRHRNSFACVALNSAVIVSDQKLKEEFDRQENIYGLDYIIDNSTIALSEQLIKEQLVYTELLFIAFDPTNISLSKRMLQIIKVAKQMDIVPVILTVLTKEQPLIEVDQFISNIKKLNISHFDLPYLKANADTINKMCVQAIRAPVEAATNIGFPSGVLEDISYVLSVKGKASIGIGYAEDQNGIVAALTDAFTSANDINISCVQGANINITSGNNDYLNHFGAIETMIKRLMPDAYNNGIYTLFTVRKPELEEKAIITVMATGIS